MDFEQASIERFKEASTMSEFYYNKPLTLLYSGGKDSDVILDLALKSGINFTVLHSHTTVDAPTTIQYIRDKFYQLELKNIDCQIIKPTYKGRLTSMWRLIPDKGIPPTRLVRYCCSVLKENAGAESVCVSGVRRAESIKRQSRGILENIDSNINNRIILNNDNDDKRRIFEKCQMKSKIMCNVIVDWDNDILKDYINSYGLTLNPLYSCGFNRVGCIGCPMAGTKGRQKEFAIYPNYKNLYIKSFDRMLDKRKSSGKDCKDWKNGVDVFHWWMQDGVLPGQLSLFDDY